MNAGAKAITRRPQHSPIIRYNSILFVSFFFFLIESVDAKWVKKDFLFFFWYVCIYRE